MVAVEKSVRGFELVIGIVWTVAIGNRVVVDRYLVNRKLVSLARFDCTIIKLGDMRVGTVGAYVIRIRITVQLRGIKTL